VVYYAYIIAAFAAFILCSITTPIFVKFGRSRKLLSAAHDPEILRPSVPDIGGITVIFSFFAALYIAALLFPNLFHDFGKAILGLCIGTFAMVVLGFIDDRKHLSPGIKFAVQVAAALAVIAFGVEIEKITNPMGAPFELGFLGIPVTVLWIVGITNAINMTDGMDGLAPGILAIASAALMVICISIGFPFLAILMSALFGSMLAFLFFNYPPAKIILGNTGAYSLGFIIATASIIHPVKASTFVVLFVPLLALGLPVLEMLVTVFRRLVKKKKIYLKDSEHIHHLLLALGLPPRIVNWFFYTLSFLFAAFAVGTATGDRNLMLGFVALLLLAFLVLAFKLMKLEKKEG